MTTKNIRAVTYLPPKYHKQLKQYMKQQKLSESAAIVEIIKQFFDGTPEPDSKLKAYVEAIVQEQLTETKAEIVQLKAQVELMQQLLKDNLTTKTPRKSRSPSTQFKVQPLSPEQLAKKLGVTVETLEAEYAKGMAHFRIWTSNKGSVLLWQKQGDLYYPLQ